MHIMVDWLHKMLSKQITDHASVRILDIGTGNALLPLQLAKLGYSNLTGSDYSEQSIALAKLILQRHKQTLVTLVVRCSTHGMSLCHVFLPFQPSCDLQVDDLLQTGITSRQVTTSTLRVPNLSVILVGNLPHKHTTC